MANGTERWHDILACPACGAALDARPDAFKCRGCGHSYPVEKRIAQFYRPADPAAAHGDVTDAVKEFYEETPFPNYDDLESRDSLARKATRSIFARLLDEQVPRGAYVLDAGCGTGQLTNFLGMAWDRVVVGADVCLNSLGLAEDFRERCAIANAHFAQINLFRPPFRDGAFDVVVSNGVLHHTADPEGGFRALVRTLKPGGHVIVGLYNTWGRPPTDWRRSVFAHFDDRLSCSGARR